jgi:hypothetical protein
MESIRTQSQIKQQQTITTESTLNSEKQITHDDLVTTVEQGPMLWAIMMLRDIKLQAIFRTFLSDRIRILLENYSGQNDANSLPSQNKSLRMILQLCQLPANPIKQMLEVDVILIREIFPSVILEALSLIQSENTLKEEEIMHRLNEVTFSMNNATNIKKDKIEDQSADVAVSSEPLQSESNASDQVEKKKEKDSKIKYKLIIDNMLSACKQFIIRSYKPNIRS